MDDKFLRETANKIANGNWQTAPWDHGNGKIDFVDLEERIYAPLTTVAKFHNPPTSNLGQWGDPLNQISADRHLQEGFLWTLIRSIHLHKLMRQIRRRIHIDQRGLPWRTRC